MALGCLSVLFISISHLSYLYSADAREPICPSSFPCQTLGSLTFPFYDSTDKQCGLCNLNCGNSPPTIQLEEKGQPYDVIRLVASDEVVIHDQEFQRLLDVKSCDTFENIVFPTSPSISFIITYNITLFKCPTTLEFITVTNDYYSYNCKEHTLYYRYPLGEDDPVPAGCSVIQLPLSVNPQRNDSSNLFKLLTADFSLQFHVSDDCIKCRGTGGQCQKHKKKFRCSTGTGSKRRFFIAVAKVIACALAGGLGITAVVALCCFRSKCSICVSMIWRKDRKEGHTTVEAVLEQYGPLAATRYTYQDVKKMTNFFKYQLGQGGNGCVYKGVLHDGRFVAVKILNNLKAEGEDFVNEVVSISRTSHINVVSLLGFCFEGSKRALIYEFMPNGSLDKFIYSNGKSSSTTRQLGRQTLYQIGLGIARGLEYLHRGCSTRILHFDIKPHNILLDEEFCPKIADFGLAKLCFGKDSIISMLGMRGTPGYIAPEVFSRNFGGVSHKSDVYSYGMMILEMVGGRKNSDQGFDHTSEKYFPQWIYNRLELDVEIGLSAISGEVESENTRKMIMVGLWCIQTDPANRPSMRKVLDMLEGSLEVLQIPSKPFLVSSPECYSTTQASQ